ncbi:basic helix-loop-helix (bHLH) DNA-binding superfamily protein [Euphorbia peplus]|nr:basic helix-loop-helix (bHLH) DNA-binding superfamily protein [Euphorbia peplus]
MRNAVFAPMSQDIYNFGNHEVEVPNLNVFTDSNKGMIMSGGGATNIFMDSQVLNLHDQQQLYDQTFAIPHQNYQSGYEFVSSTWEDLQGSMIPSTMDQIELTTLKKRSIEDISSFCGRDKMNVSENSNEGKKIKRSKVASSRQQWHHQSSITIEQKMPIRRSQKLNNKITALQKLVSPYGKTDTASVLEEASLYIKLLQQKIQILYQMLNKSSSSQNTDGNLLDQERGGVCLFPISDLDKLCECSNNS